MSVATDYRVLIPTLIAGRECAAGARVPLTERQATYLLLGGHIVPWTEPAPREERRRDE